MFRPQYQLKIFSSPRTSRHIINTHRTGKGKAFPLQAWTGPGSSRSQTKHQLDATLCRFYFCRVTLHDSGAGTALIRRCDDLRATITHVPVAAVLVLNTPDDGRLRPNHVE